VTAEAFNVYAFGHSRVYMVVGFPAILLYTIEGVSKLGDSYHTYWKGQAVSDNQRYKVCSINKASTVGTPNRHLLTGKRGLPWHCRLLK